MPLDDGEYGVVAADDVLVPVALVPSQYQLTPPGALPLAVIEPVVS